MKRCHIFPFYIPDDQNQIPLLDYNQEYIIFQGSLLRKKITRLKGFIGNHEVSEIIYWEDISAPQNERIDIEKIFDVPDHVFIGKPDKLSQFFKK